VVVFILINFELGNSTNISVIQIHQITLITENFEEKLPILNPNIDNIESEEAELMPSLLIKIDKTDSFNNEILDNITMSGFDVIYNETKKYGNNEYLLRELNNTDMALKLNDLLDKSISNITSEVLRISEPF
jgi:hypothetical protein